MSWGDPRTFLSNVGCSTEGCTSMAVRVIQSATNGRITAHCNSHKAEPDLVAGEMSAWGFGGAVRYVQKVVFPGLDELRFDRRGTIVEFHMFREIGHAGLTMLYSLISLLSGSFHVDTPTATGEVCDCWVRSEIRYVGGPQVVSVHHKYWGQDQIDCFKEMVKALARLHNWVIEGDGCGLLDALAELAPEKPRRRR